MSSSLHPYKFWEQDGQYFFDTPSGARYVAYYLELSSLAENLYTFNFDRIKDGNHGVVDSNVFDTVCTILSGFFLSHKRSMLVVCDTVDGREEARMRLFNSWFHRVAPPALHKVDKAGRADTYNLFISLLYWSDNPHKDNLLAILEEYCATMLV